MLTPREATINIFKIISFTLFLFTLGKILIGLNSKNNERILVGFGFLSIFFGLISLIPRTIINFTSSYNNKIFNNRVYEYNINIFKGINYIFCDYIILFFISLFLLTYIFYWKQQEKVSNTVFENIINK